VTLLELPDVPLIRVLYFIDLEDLLLVVKIFEELRLVTRK
jgi:hypothetical protein